MDSKAEESDVTDRPSAEAIDQLFIEYVDTRSRRTRATLVEAHMGFAHHMAKRFARRGVAEDDLRQIAFLGLVKAVDRFDPNRGVAFTTFAGRTVEGEIKRHFRDQAWGVHVPRSTKELHLRIRTARDELSHDLGRSPTLPEVAERLGVSTDEVVEATAAGAGFTPATLDSGLPGDRSSRLAADDMDLAHSEDRLTVEALMATLPEREREIVRLAFFDGLTQTEIGDRLDISQMHVSRLLRQSFELMRRAADESDEL